MPAQTIVVPLDGSPFAEQALPVARWLARRVDARLVLVMRTWDGWTSDGCTAYLEGIAQEDVEIATDIVLKDEFPTARAIELVASDGPDRIVCMTSHGRGSFRWAVLGSVAEQVVRNSREPLFVVGRHCRAVEPSEGRHMLVCVDGTNLAEPIVPVALRWAKALGLDARIALVVHPLDVEGTAHPNAVVDALVEQFIAQGVDATPVLLRGSHIAGAIADFANTLPAAIVAMNTHARGGAARLALGSVAMGTVGLVDSPVLLAPWPG